MTYDRWFHSQQGVAYDGAYQFAKAAWKYQEERIAEVRKAERERIAEYVDRNIMSCREYAEAIRAMED